MLRTFPLLLALAVSPGVSAQDSAAESGMNQRANHYLDHIVLGIDDLEKGIEALEHLTGVRAKFDGRDARLGTQSAVIGLGENAFLEIMAPDPKADPALVEPGYKSMILDRLDTFDTLTPFLWAVGTSNLERTRWIARRAGSYPSEIESGTRERGWGRSTQWTWAHVTRPHTYVLPIFVQWNADTKPPQKRAPEGCRLVQLKLYARIFKSVHSLLAAMQVAVALEGAQTESIDVVLECPEGEVLIEGPALTGQGFQPGWGTRACSHDLNHRCFD